ncbi:MAG TPA: transcriptional repressor LexA [Longimicrobiales bacterium]|nr:transcriptional repressor LexA [Longimicrobiales bacterium]
MAEPLTSLERRILDWLIEYVRRHTYQPSIREIGAEFGIKSTKTVSELIQSLADKGWVQRDPSRSRGLRLLGLELDADVVSVPHIDVHLSDPSLEDPLESLTLDRKLAGGAGSFMISMVGNDMRDAGIRDGDLLLVEPVPVDELADGDLVVARISGDTRVRRFERRGGGRIVLDAPGTSPTVMTAAALEILGRIAAVIRRLRTDAPAGLAGERKGKGAIAG